jgi:hypothetical protein
MKDMKKVFSPVLPIYHELFASEQEKGQVKVFFFGIGTEVLEAKGKITQLIEEEKHEEFLLFNSGEKVRIDRIITVNGKPGPAYDEYDRYALACLDCSAGM